MSVRSRFLIFLTAWLIVLMPFLFWWNTWFGRQLSDKQLVEYLQDKEHPRHIQHALVQIGEHSQQSVMKPAAGCVLPHHPSIGVAYLFDRI